MPSMFLKYYSSIVECLKTRKRHMLHQESNYMTLNCTNLSDSIKSLDQLIFSFSHLAHGGEVKRIKRLLCSSKSESD